METQFGYNCSNYLPSLKKCRRMIDLLISRKDLLERKTVNTIDLLLYYGLSNDTIIAKIAEGEIKIVNLNKKPMQFEILAPWQYDDCALEYAGGQCLYFEQHNGRRLKCLMEYDSTIYRHPNYDLLPGEEQIKQFEMKVTNMSHISQKKP